MKNIPKDFNLFGRDNLNIILITVVFFYFKLSTDIAEVGS